MIEKGWLSGFLLVSGISPTWPPSSTKALSNHRSCGLVVVIPTQLHNIPRVGQQIQLIGTNCVALADYVVQLGIPSPLADSAYPSLSDSTHFIPSVSTVQSTWLGRLLLLPWRGPLAVLN